MFCLASHRYRGGHGSNPVVALKFVSGGWLNCSHTARIFSFISSLTVHICLSYIQYVMSSGGSRPPAKGGGGGGGGGGIIQAGGNYVTM